MKPPFTSLLYDRIPQRQLTLKAAEARKLNYLARLIIFTHWLVVGRQSILMID